MTVPAYPPGISRRDLSGMNPSERIVFASSRPFAVVAGSPNAAVLMAVRAARYEPEGSAAMSGRARHRLLA